MWVSLLAAGALLVIAVLFGAYLAQVRIYGPVQFAERSATLRNRPVINGMIMFKRELGEAALDAVLVCVAFLGAFVLHYGLPNPAAPGPGSVPDAAGPAVRVAAVRAGREDVAVAGLSRVSRHVALRRRDRSDDAGQSVAVLSSAILLIALPFVVREHHRAALGAG